MLTNPEALEMVEISKTTGRLVQVGSQSLSMTWTQKAREWVQAGQIGSVFMVQCSIYRPNAIGAWRYPVPPDASPKTVDWDRFQANVPKHPFDAARFFPFRNWYDYSAGIAGDEYVHLLSRVHYVLGVQYPQSAVSNGGIYKWTGDRDVSDIHNTMYDYGKFQAVVNANLVCNWDGGEIVRFFGDKGTVELTEWAATLAPYNPIEEYLYPNGCRWTPASTCSRSRSLPGSPRAPSTSSRRAARSEPPSRNPSPTPTCSAARLSPRSEAAGARRAAEAEIRRAHALGVQIVGRDEPTYPTWLRRLYAAPPVLWVRGSLAVGEGEGALAVVGSRAATPLGLAFAHKLAAELAACGLTIVSGLARGIDSAAHRGALDAHGRTVAVLGSGLDRLYPPENAALADRVATWGSTVRQTTTAHRNKDIRAKWSLGGC